MKEFSHASLQIIFERPAFRIDSGIYVLFLDRTLSNGASDFELPGMCHPVIALSCSEDPQEEIPCLRCADTLEQIETQIVFLPERILRIVCGCRPQAGWWGVSAQQENRKFNAKTQRRKEIEPHNNQQSSSEQSK